MEAQITFDTIDLALGAAGVTYMNGLEGIDLDVPAEKREAVRKLTKAFRDKVLGWGTEPGDGSALQEVYVEIFEGEYVHFNVEHKGRDRISNIDVEEKRHAEVLAAVHEFGQALYALVQEG